MSKESIVIVEEQIPKLNNANPRDLYRNTKRHISKARTFLVVQWLYSVYGNPPFARFPTAPAPQGAPVAEPAMSPGKWVAVKTQELKLGMKSGRLWIFNTVHIIRCVCVCVFNLFGGLYTPLWREMLQIPLYPEKER